MEEHDLKKIQLKLYNYCSKREKCEFDVRKYLLKEDLLEKEISDLIVNLEENNFINSERYINAFIKDKLKFNKWGKIKIHFELKARNFDEKIIYKYLNEIDEQEYEIILKSIIENKIKQLNNKENYKQTLINFALNRGFEYQKIQKMIEEND
ncbi:MAG: RecX family transcriptional regulator [Bacteroidales bacterium]|jgi:regulatory protein|nr:RecX family transcriptional regulator [Bacteroidales bacterium]